MLHTGRSLELDGSTELGSVKAVVAKLGGATVPRLKMDPTPALTLRSVAAPVCTGFPPPVLACTGLPPAVPLIYAVSCVSVLAIANRPKCGRLSKRLGFLACPVEI